MADSLDTFCEDRISEVCALADRLLSSRFKSSHDLWTLQLDTIALQSDLQTRIATAKREKSEIGNRIRSTIGDPPSEPNPAVRSLQKDLEDARARIGILEHAYKLCRQFGNAYAWVLFGCDRRKIDSLSKNSRNPPPPNGPSLKGMIAAAEGLGRKFRLMPVLHDMTDDFSVGDISFVSSEIDPITAEIKSTAMSETSGVSEFRFHMTEEQRKHLEQRAPDFGLSHRISQDEAAKSRLQQLFASERAKRQMIRLQEALQFQHASKRAELYIDNGNQMAFVTPKGLSIKEHWGVAAEIAETARRDGFATRVVEGAFLYAAQYSERPQLAPHKDTFDVSNWTWLPSRVVDSGIFLDQKDKNALWFEGTPSFIGHSVPKHIRPLFIHPFPAETVFDLVSGRLVIFVFISLGKVVQNLELLGFEAALAGANTQRDFIHIRSRVMTKLGTELKMELRGMTYHAHQLGLEYLSLDSFVRMAQAMVERSSDHASEMEQGPLPAKSESTDSMTDGETSSEASDVEFDVELSDGVTTDGADPTTA